MRYSAIFVGFGLLCLLVGEGFGIWMSQDPNRFSLAPAHAHLNLAGWVTLALYGLIHRAYPALATAKLAVVQCALAILGAALVMPGILIAITSGDQDIGLAIFASICIALGTLTFAIMFVGKVTMAREVK